jgi:tripartite-type tricarboxylate transporter receptor subunit TctC
MSRAHAVIFAGLVAVACVDPSHGQSWPQKPIKIMLPFAVGGSGDIVARIIAPRLGEGLGQQIIVDNRPGASGAIATEAVARAAPDGYTLLKATPSQLAILPAIAKTPYDPIRDFTPVSMIGSNPLVLIVHPGVPARTLAEFRDLVGRQPAKFTYAGSGPGALTTLAMALFVKRAGLNMIPVMYKGGGPALTDVLAGHVDAYFANLSVVVPYAGTGALRLLAVSSERRAPQIPDVPTFAEAGLPGLRIQTWSGLVAPAGTPAPIVERIAREVAATVKDPKVAERLAAEGIDPLGTSSRDFARLIAEDVVLWGEAVKLAGAREQ